MLRHAFIFLATFVVGALVALVARTATHQPETGHVGHAAPAAEYAPLVTNTAAPAKATSSAAPEAQGSPHHPANPSTTVSADKPVNTRCAICGMDVDPKLPTLEYQGKKIAFGCRMCPPKFKADPDKYGPYYLRNEVIGR